jgi:hypothetical protein
MPYEFEYDGELDALKENYIGKTIILTEDCQIDYFDLFAKLGEILRPEQEREYDDEINY